MHLKKPKFSSFLFLTIPGEPCYNQLRTKEQLGYIVFCASRKSNGAQGIRFIVQSAKHPMYVEERIETFLDTMVVRFKTFSNISLQNYF